MPRVVVTTGVPFGAKISTPSCRRPPGRAAPQEFATRCGRAVMTGFGRRAGTASVASVYTNHARSAAGRTTGMDAAIAADARMNRAIRFTGTESSVLDEPSADELGWRARQAAAFDGRADS